MDEQTPKVKSLYKALKLLDLFDAAHPERGINELAEASGMLKSSAYNIMSTFRQCGFIEKNRQTGKYRLSNKILQLANTLLNTDQLRQFTKPYMDTLAKECGEVVYLARPDAPYITYLDSSHPPGAMFARVISGLKAEMFCTGLGKAMLAFMDEATLVTVIEAGLPRATPYTITNPDALRDDLEETRQRGYAIDNMEHEYGIRCVGVPIRNYHGDVVAGLSISGPSLRVMDDRVTFFADKLRQATEELQPQLR
ncbi:MAG: IclR family transcriptional regulator [Planctomycetaceae bacterium]|nr:IclR family transcriptional regulator [Planctomycetaceae bacterium]